MIEDNPGINQNYSFPEEVLASASALWFSPDGRHLAFATFNDTNVKDISIPVYGEPGSMKDQYPSEMKIKYPKVINLLRLFLSPFFSEIYKSRGPFPETDAQRVRKIDRIG